VLLRKKLTVLLATVMMLGVMSVSPALAAPGGNSPCNPCGHQADDTLDRNKGGGDDHIKQNNGKGND
jgi:hypothetical protein